MPFLEHFNLSEYPFGLSPNPHLFYPSTNAQSMLAALEFSITRGDGLLKVVGEVGTGKTLLCHMLIGRLEKLSMNTAYLNAPVAVTSTFLPMYVAREFGLKPKNQEDSVRVLGDYLLKEHAKGKRNILIVDEAQALDAKGLEAIRLLSNLETETQKLLQIVLFGQRELDKILHRPDLRQIAQRLNFSFVTQPFSSTTTADYVRFRMERCSKKAKNKTRISEFVFTPDALHRLAKISKGLPRVIHLIADKALLAAYAEGSEAVERRHVNTAVKETPDLRLGWWPFAFNFRLH